jgi:hypothetical protein
MLRVLGALLLSPCCEKEKRRKKKRLVDLQREGEKDLKTSGERGNEADKRVGRRFRQERRREESSEERESEERKKAIEARRNGKKSGWIYSLRRW